MTRYLSFLLAVPFIVGCPKDRSEVTWDRDGEAPPERFVYGLVTNARTGDLLDDVEMKVGDVTTMSVRGFFMARKVPPGRLLLKSDPPGFAPGTKPVDVPEAGGVFVRLPLVPYEATATFAAETGGEVSTEEGAKVAFPPCAIDAEGEVTASLAVVDARAPCDLGALPGDFSTDEGEMLESFGAVAVEVVDEDGDPVDPGDCDAEVQIPAPNDAPDAVDQWKFDPDQGKWTRAGQGFDCVGTETADDSCQGNLPSLGWWNVDKPLETTCVRACVVDESDRPASGVEVTARGVDYRGSAVEFTGEDGCTCLAVRRAGTVTVTANGPLGSSSVLTFTARDALGNCESDDCEELPQTLRIVRPPFQAFMTWDDSYFPWRPRTHLTGPCAPDDEVRQDGAASPMCSDGTGKFHICPGRRGSPFGPPHAHIYRSHGGSTVDGPCVGYASELISITRFEQGRYRFSVAPEGYNPADIVESLAGSDARVSVLLPTGAVKEYTLPSTVGEWDAWVVGEINCSSSRCAWTSLDTVAPTTELSTFDPEGLASSCGDYPNELE